MQYYKDNVIALL